MDLSTTVSVIIFVEYDCLEELQTCICYLNTEYCDWVLSMHLGPLVNDYNFKLYVFLFISVLFNDALSI
jgi:hypothetical protein